jgi:hypothetical protein
MAYIELVDRAEPKAEAAAE